MWHLRSAVRWHWVLAGVLTMSLWIHLLWRIRSWPTWAELVRDTSPHVDEVPWDERRVFVAGPDSATVGRRHWPWQRWARRAEARGRWEEALMWYRAAAAHATGPDTGLLLAVARAALHSHRPAVAQEALQDYERRTPAWARNTDAWQQLRQALPAGAPPPPPPPVQPVLGGLRWDVWLAPVGGVPRPRPQPQARGQRGGGGGRDPVEGADAQNVHDHAVVQSLAPLAKALGPPVNGDVDVAVAVAVAVGSRDWESWLQQWIVGDPVHGTPWSATVQHRARLVTYAMRQHNTWMVAYEAHEYALLERVVRRIQAEAGGNPERAALWRRLLVEQLADAVEEVDGAGPPTTQVVCASGRVARVLQTLTVGTHEPVPVLTATMWRQELLRHAALWRRAAIAALSAAAQRRMGYVDAADDADDAASDATAERDVDDFYRKWPGRLRDRMMAEFVQPGYLTREFVEAELDAWGGADAV